MKRKMFAAVLLAVSALLCSCGDTDPAQTEISSVTESSADEPADCCKEQDGSRPDCCQNKEESEADCCKNKDESEADCCKDQDGSKPDCCNEESESDCCKHDES